MDGCKYRLAVEGPVVENINTYADDWRFQYGRNTHTSKVEEETTVFSQAILKDVVLHQNSNSYYGPLKLHCYGCSHQTMFGAPNAAFEERFEMRWYNLDLDDPRTDIVKMENPYFCENCEEGEYYC